MLVVAPHHMRGASLIYVAAAFLFLVTLVAFGWFIAWRCILSRFSAVRKVVREMFGVGETQEHKAKLALARAKRIERRRRVSSPFATDMPAS